MVVRIALYPVREGKNAERWIKDNAERLRSAPGVKDAHFIRSTDQEGRYAGAILFFSSPAALEMYRGSDVFQEVTREIREEWVDPSQEVRQGEYEILG